MGNVASCGQGHIVKETSGLMYGGEAVKQVRGNDGTRNASERQLSSTT